MNWKLILVISLAGIAMGFASVYGFTVGIEWIIWLILFIIFAVVIARAVHSRYFLHGLIIGFLLTVITTLIQFLFFDTYAANNPLPDPAVNPVPGNLKMNVVLLLSAPVIGIISGAALGLFTWLASKLIKAKQVTNNGIS